MNTLPLFNHEEDGGFRLIHSEFLNWGTFDSLWKITPNGKSSLLTGANGSGKTTIVDVINTLLVPPVVRHYNQSSGAERRRERTEESYVLGAYGNIKDEDSSFVKVQNLRDKTTYSIITGIFFNSANNTHVTLGQIRYFNNSGLEKVYFIADEVLTVSDDILPFDNRGEYKRRLTKRGVKFFGNNFKQYSSVFIKKLGFKSEKALNLFSQTVGVKVLGNINDFIRNHMLEKGHAQEKFEGVYQNFLHLLNTQKLIEKAELELQLLEKIKLKGEKYLNYFNKLLEYDQKIRLFTYFESNRLMEFSITQSKLLIKDLESSQYQLDNITNSLGQLFTQISDTANTIRLNESAEQLRRIDDKIKNLEDKIRDKKNNWERYNEFTGKIGLNTPSDLKNYNITTNRLETLFSELKVTDSEKKELVFTKQTLINSNNSERNELKKEFNSLKNRDSNIPLKNIEIRDEIALGVGLKPHELPFVGECLMVKEDEPKWEKGIERVLYSFSLSLIVSNQIYKRVNTYINENNLKGRVVYFRANTNNIRFNTQIEEESLINKVIVKPSSTFKEWITVNLHQKFNYFCTDDLSTFSRLDYALTSNGLIKRGDRHEKDDRSFNSFVLGWDNLKKRAKLEKLIKSLDSIIDKEESVLKGLKDESEKVAEDLTTIITLQNYKFENIDFFTFEKELMKISEDRSEILLLATDLNRLQDKLNRLKKDEGELKDRERQLNRAIGVLENKIEELTIEKKRLSDLIENFNLDAKDNSILDQLLSQFIKKYNGDISRITEYRESISQKSRTLRDKKEAALTGVISNMASFINPHRDIINKFPSWSEDVRDLSANIEYLNDFTELYNRVLKNDLPKYRKKFKEFLNQRVMEDMASFQQTLHDELTQIKESLLDLNRSLKGIRYQENPGTYLTLNSENTRDVLIREFQRDLKNTFADAYKLATGEFKEMELFFEKSRKLLTKLKDDDNRRKKVLDVRNWLNFSAEERFLEDGTLKQVYQDSQSLSGGEKAKLAYTVLASAIAYQFGIESKGNSFKFVVVDEAFSKVDPTNSKFAMNLFKKLDLQLMVVTPLDRINMVEEYINSVQYVETGEGNKTMVYNMELNEFREKKEKFLK